MGCQELLSHIILEQYGGVYFDVNYQVKKYFLELHYMFQFYIPINSYGWLYHDIIASKKQHLYHGIFYKHIIKCIFSSDKRLDVFFKSYFAHNQYILNRNIKNIYEDFYI